MVHVPTLVTLVALKLLLHVAFNRRYGYFRDELYYFACGERLAWGYVDHPPLIAAAARATRALFGNSLSAVRLLPALAGAAKVGLSVVFAAQLGADPWAQLLTGLAVLIAPIYLIFDNMLTMNAFEPVFWLGAAAIVQMLAAGGDPSLWLLFAATVGVGFLNKYTMLWFAGSLVIALAVTGDWPLFATPWFWIGGALALAIVAPHLLWSVRHGFSCLELQRLSLAKNRPMSLPAFLVQQAYLVHPLTLPLWLAGLASGITGPVAESRRHFAVTYVLLLVLVRALKGKGYYLTPIYPLLTAAGSIVLVQAAQTAGHHWLPAVAAAALIIGGVITAPLGLPILSPRAFLKYWSVFGTRQLSTETFDSGMLPQHYADMFGWETLADAVARVYDTLPADDKKQCVIFAQNYGQAGAIGFFGRRYGLPQVISGHQHYFCWGPGPCTGDVMIVVGGEREKLIELFDSVQLAAVSDSEYSMPFEHQTSIFVCRRIRQPLQQLWPAVKVWN